MQTDLGTRSMRMPLLPPLPRPDKPSSAHDKVTDLAKTLFEKLDSYEPEPVDKKKKTKATIIRSQDRHKSTRPSKVSLAPLELQTAPKRQKSHSKNGAKQAVPPAPTQTTQSKSSGFVVSNQKSTLSTTISSSKSINPPASSIVQFQTRKPVPSSVEFQVRKPVASSLQFESSKHAANSVQIQTRKPVASGVEIQCRRLVAPKQEQEQQEQVVIQQGDIEQLMRTNHEFAHYMRELDSIRSDWEGQRKGGLQTLERKLRGLQGTMARCGQVELQFLSEMEMMQEDLQDDGEQAIHEEQGEEEDD